MPDASHPTTQLETVPLEPLDPALLRPAPKPLQLLQDGDAGSCCGGSCSIG